MTDDRRLLAEALPRYDVGDEIGRGGWGVVYRGEHRDLGRGVAIKQLNQTVDADSSARARFVAEARLIASLEHPHIVPVYDYVEREGMCAIVMELATGGTLTERVNAGDIGPDHALAVGLATAAGLHHAHTQQLLHRDVKPDNVLFTGGTVKIADFGIAKVMGAGAAGHTATGAIIGTPAYMAPEQVQGRELTAATDVYALAVMVYQLLTGDLPYPVTGDAISQLYQHVHTEPRPLIDAGPNVDAGVAAVVHRAMAKEPLERPPTAEQFAIDLASTATRWLGPGWLHRTGIGLMGSTAVISATHTAAGDPDHGSPQPPGNAPATVIEQRPQSTQPTVTSHQPPPQRGGPPPVGGPVRTGPPSSDTVGGPSPESEPRPSRGPAIAALALVALVIAAIAVAAIRLDGGGGGGETVDATAPDGSTADGEPVEGVDGPISAAELDTFRAACENGGVSSTLCGCVADRAPAQLGAEAFRAGLTTMLASERGTLSPELEAVFSACQTDGF